MENNTNINDLGKIIRDISKNTNILKDISDLCVVIKSLSIPEVDDTVKKNTVALSDFCNNSLQPILQSLYKINDMFGGSVIASQMTVIQMKFLIKNFIDLNSMIFDAFNSIDEMNIDMIKLTNWSNQINIISKKIHDILFNISDMINEKKNPFMSSRFKLFIFKYRVKISLKMLKNIISNIDEFISYLQNTIQNVKIVDIAKNVDSINEILLNMQKIILSVLFISQCFVVLLSIIPFLKISFKSLKNIFELLINFFESIKIINLDDVKNIVNNINNILSELIILSSLLIISVTIIPAGIIAGYIVISLLFVFKYIINTIISIFSKIDTQDLSIVITTLNIVNDIFVCIAKLIFSIIIITPIMIVFNVLSLVILLNIFLFKIIINTIISIFSKIDTQDLSIVITTLNIINDIFVCIAELISTMLMILPLIIMMPIIGTIIMLGMKLFKVIINYIISTLSDIDSKSLDIVYIALNQIFMIFLNIIKIFGLMVLMLPLILVLPVLSIGFMLFFWVFRSIINSIIRIAKAALPILDEEFEKIFICLGNLIKTINTHVKISPLLTLRLNFLKYAFKKIVTTIMEIAILMFSAGWLMKIGVVYINLHIQNYLNLLTNIIDFIDNVFRLTSTGRMIKMWLSEKTTLKRLKKLIEFVNKVIDVIISNTKKSITPIKLVKYIIQFRLITILIDVLKNIYSSITGVMFGLFFKKNSKLLLSVVKFIKKFINRILEIKLSRIIKARKRLKLAVKLFESILKIMLVMIAIAILAIPAIIAAAAILISMTAIVLSIKGILLLFKLISQKEIKKANKKLRGIMLLLASVILICTALALFAIAITKMSQLILIGLLIFVAILILLALTIKTMSWIFGKLVKLKDILSIMLVISAIIIIIGLLYVISFLLIKLQEQVKQIEILTIILFLVGFIVLVAIFAALGWLCITIAPVLVPGVIAMLLVSMAMVVIVGALFLIAYLLNKLSEITLDPEAISNVVNTIFDTANSIIDAIFKNGREEPKESAGKESWWKSALKWLGDSAVSKLFKALMTMVYLAQILASVYLIKWIANCLNELQEIKLDKNKVNSGVDLVLTTADSLVKNISKYGDGEFKKAQKNLNKYESITKSLVNIQKRLIAVGNAKLAVDGCNNLITVVSKFNDTFNKIDDTKAVRATNSYIGFLKQVNSMKLKNLETAAKMFEEMAKFSESINGNFDQLAETINEKIAPLLEELKESMSKVAENSDRPTDIQAEKISIKNQMRESGQTRNMTDREIDNKVNNKYNEQQQQKLGIDEITEKLTALINLFQSGEAIVRTS